MGQQGVWTALVLHSIYVKGQLKDLLFLKVKVNHLTNICSLKNNIGRVICKQSICEARELIVICRKFRVPTLFSKTHTFVVIS